METHSIESRCYRSGRKVDVTVCERVPVSFSPGILQAVAVMGLSFLFLGVQSVQIFALYARFRLCQNALRVLLGLRKAT